MKRRISPLIAAVFAVAVLLACAPGHAASIVLTYANFPPATTFPSIQMERWAKEVEKRTGGRVKVQTFPGGTLLPAKNIFDGVVAGMADIGNFAMSYQPGRFPLSEAIDLPVGFRNARAASMALFDLIEKYQPKEFAKVKLITVFTCPPADIMTRIPVRSLKEIKGMELRTSGTGTDVLRRIGAIPIGMPQSEAPEAIQKGIVKGNVSSMEILKDFNFAAYLPYAAEANLFVVSFAVVMNKDRWDSLPADVKKVIDGLSREQAEWTGAYVDDHVREALEWSKKKYGHQVIRLSDADQSEISRLTRPMIDDYVRKVTAQGLPGREIMKDVYALKQKHEKKYR
ncbi:MAG: C4-dicarboxylate-binding periplasmic protein precursor [Syntrophorhabdus sp. PtaB.Bin047]|jgi:TRAP-type C4-dicarboxylate transport system substrate-binding protein|nr:MAG: C4-dicarboxylate-binding periplasmic protein precursor [Syntrophorhabdus sp. PtaB.Bin047]